MISIDQVMLLEQKVESAVAKIQQLQAENAALRSECEKLTNALLSKSEQLSSYENDQTKIESGIRKALERLNTIENSVLRAAASQLPVHPVEKTTVQSPVEKPVIPVVTQPVAATFETMQEIPNPNESVSKQKAPIPYTEDIPDDTEENDFDLVQDEEPSEEKKVYNSIDSIFSQATEESFTPFEPSEDIEQEEFPENNPDESGFDIF